MSEHKRRFLTRRRFLGASLAGTAAGGFWLALSSSWPARFLRARLAEFGREVAPAPFHPKPASWSNDVVTAAWIGHATVLLNILGVRVLTDPVFFSRIGLNAAITSIGPKRLVAAALAPDEVGPVDLVLLSHAHFDHLDTRSLASLPGRPHVITAKATSDLVPTRRVASVQELRWGEQATVQTPNGEVRVECIEVKHWGARLRRDTYRGYGGYILEREGVRILFGGDTAYTPAIGRLRSKGPFALALMPIGAYDPWIWNHCTPEQALEMADSAGAVTLLPIHHQTFRLSREPMREPIERLVAAIDHQPERLGWREIGETYIYQPG